MVAWQIGDDFKERNLVFRSWNRKKGWRDGGMEEERMVGRSAKSVRRDGTGMENNA